MYGGTRDVRLFVRGKSHFLKNTANRAQLRSPVYVSAIGSLKSVLRRIHCLVSRHLVLKYVRALRESDDHLYNSANDSISAGCIKCDVCCLFVERIEGYFNSFGCVICHFHTFAGTV